MNLSFEKDPIRDRYSLKSYSAPLGWIVNSGGEYVYYPDLDGICVDATFLVAVADKLDELNRGNQ